MTHKNGEWFCSKPVQTGRYYSGGNGERPCLAIAQTYGLYTVRDIPSILSAGWWVRVGDLDPIPPVPVPRPEAVDTPVEVRDSELNQWLPRHLAGWTEDGKILTWFNGGTSWSRINNGTTSWWTQWKLPEETDGTRT